MSQCNGESADDKNVRIPLTCSNNLHTWQSRTQINGTLYNDWDWYTALPSSRRTVILWSSGALEQRQRFSFCGSLQSNKYVSSVVCTRKTVQREN